MRQILFWLAPRGTCMIILICCFRTIVLKWHPPLWRTGCELITSKESKAYWLSKQAWVLWYLLIAFKAGVRTGGHAGPSTLGGWHLLQKQPKNIQNYGQTDRWWIVAIHVCKKVNYQSHLLVRFYACVYLFEHLNIRWACCSERLVLDTTDTAVKFLGIEHQAQVSIVGSVVECSPATRAARVRFPDDAQYFFSFQYTIDSRSLQCDTGNSYIPHVEIADPRRTRSPLQPQRTGAISYGQKSFQIIGFCLNLRGWCPTPSGKSWICHWWWLNLEWGGGC